MRFFEGQRLSFQGQRCTVRYVGPVADVTGEWLGVEWDDTNRGKHDGMFKDERYFTCSSGGDTAGSFIRSTRSPDKTVQFLDAVQEKYIQDGHSDDGNKSKRTYFNGKLAEEIGFDKIRRHFASLSALKVIVVDDKCIKGPLSESSLEKVPNEELSGVLEEIGRACASVRELGLAGNLFESIKDVAMICRALPYLIKLDLSRNRFTSVGLEKGEDPRDAITVRELALDSTLLNWEDLASICRFFPALIKISFARNCLRQVTCCLPADIEEINLSENEVVSLVDLLPLTEIPTLRRLTLQGCPLSTLGCDLESISFPNMIYLDISNSKLSRNELDFLQISFPNLKSLRCSGLSEGDLFEIIARTGSLETLNSNNINPTTRVNAEIYYLGRIAEELSTTGEPKDTVLKRHPRWEELCAVYDEPALRSSAHVAKVTNAFKSSLLEITAWDSRRNETTTDFRNQLNPFHLRLPRSLKTHQLYEQVAEQLSTYPRLLRIIWQRPQLLEAEEQLPIDGSPSTCKVVASKLQVLADHSRLPDYRFGHFFRFEGLTNWQRLMCTEYQVYTPHTWRLSRTSDPALLMLVCKN